MVEQECEASLGFANQDSNSDSDSGVSSELTKSGVHVPSECPGG